VSFARFADPAGLESVVLEGRLETGETLREEITASSAPLVESAEDVSDSTRGGALAKTSDSSDRGTEEISSLFTLPSHLEGDQPCQASCAGSRFGRRISV
jgi:hypothetical protein